MHSPRGRPRGLHRDHAAGLGGHPGRHPLTGLIVQTVMGLAHLSDGGFLPGLGISPAGHDGLHGVPFADPLAWMR